MVAQATKVEEIPLPLEGVQGSVHHAHGVDVKKHYIGYPEDELEESSSDTSG